MDDAKELNILKESDEALQELLNNLENNEEAFEKLINLLKSKNGDDNEKFFIPL